MKVLLIGFVICFLLTYMTNMKLEKVGIVALLFMGIVAYYFDPYIANEKYRFYTDLVRFFNELKIIRESKISNAILSNIYPFNFEYSGLVVNNIFLFLISKSNNFHLLPLFSCVINYGTIFITIGKIIKNESTNKHIKGMCIAIIFLVIDYTSIICNIRNPFVFTIGLCLLYWDIVEKKSSFFCIIIYILLIFVHPVAIIILLFRLIAIVLNKYTNKIFELGIIIAITLIPILMNTIINIKSTNQYIGMVFNKINAYGGAQSDLQQYGTTSLFWITVCKCCLFAIGLIIIRIYGTKQKYIKFIQLGNISLCCCIGSYFLNIHMFYRMSYLITVFLLLIIPIVYSSINNFYYINNHNEKMRIIYYIFTVFVDFVILINFYYYYCTLNYQMLNLGG